MPGGSFPGSLSNKGCVATRALARSPCYSQSQKIGTMFCNIRYWPMLVTSHCVQNLGPIENPRNLQFIRRTICSNKASVCTVGWHLQMQDYGCFLIRHEIPHSFVTAIHVSRLYKLQCHARNLALKDRCTFCSGVIINAHDTPL